MQMHAVLPLALSAALEICLAYTLEMQAIRYTSARIVSTLFSLDPAVAVLAGFIVLNQHFRVLDLVGLACVVVAGAAVALNAPVPSGWQDK